MMEVGEPFMAGNHKRVARICTVCGKQGADSDIKRHIESKHEGMIHFSCKFMNCAYVTDDKRSFNDHTGAHNSLFKCDHCDKVLARPRALKRHRWDEALGDERCSQRSVVADVQQEVQEISFIFRLFLNCIFKKYP